MKPRDESTFDVHYKSYAALFQTGHYLLDSAERHQEGRRHNLQAATVFFAFAFEAYLNHVGFEEFRLWGESDRTSYKSKLDVLSKRLGFPLSDQSFQIVNGLFQLRNSLAHGRTRKIKDAQTGKPLTFNDVAWERLTVETVRAYEANIRKGIELIAAARSQPDMNLMNKYKASFPK